MTSDFAAGNYRFIPAVFQYSAGAAAGSGYEIERVRFEKPVPLAEGFAQIAKYIQAAGRPLTSFCACELRSPAAFTDEGFRNFNLHYVKTLAEWGVYDGKTNPVARSNVCPEIDPPARAVVLRLLVHAAEPGRLVDLCDRRQRRVAGGRVRPMPSAPCVTATSALTAWREKVRYVVERHGKPHGRVRLRLEGCHCGADLHRARLPSRSCRCSWSAAAPCAAGLTWHFARPPVIDLEYEMDCRRVMREMVI